MASMATSRASQPASTGAAGRSAAQIVSVAQLRSRRVHARIDRVSLAVWSALLGAIAAFWIVIAWQAVGAFG